MDTLRTPYDFHRNLGIGDKNVAMAKTMLAENGIRLNRQKTGGLNGYNIWYHTDTDRLFVRTINEGHEPQELLGT